MERANLWVPERYLGYQRIVELIEEHGGPSPAILAGPDCPEIYFLSRRQNPTPTIYEFMDRVPLDRRRVGELVERHDVRLVVVNRAPEFSEPWSPEVLGYLAEHFTNGEAVGPMLVLWR